MIAKLARFSVKWWPFNLVWIRASQSETIFAVYRLSSEVLRHNFVNSYSLSSHGELWSPNWKVLSHRYLNNFINSITWTTTIIYPVAIFEVVMTNTYWQMKLQFVAALKRPFWTKNHFERFSDAISHSFGNKYCYRRAILPRNIS